MPNRLINSTSPYLLQHAHNPVDWFPWSEEALQKASEEDKLIILSIGYSTCHWCHVMEKNCFENQEIADLMNKHYVCIKVDREERPDLDQIYMDALHLMGQRGGWPLNVFLLPDQSPFFGGTYFPPDHWKRLLSEINDAYQTRRRELWSAGQDLRAALQTSVVKRFQDMNSQTEREQEKPSEILSQILESLKARFDEQWGGFGAAPKFPTPCVLDMLLFYHHITDDKSALHMLTHTLEKMAFGGIHDHLGGGFARYSVDTEWKVPHFEKMLYDNAQLLTVFSHAYGATLDIMYRDVAFGIVNFVRNELTSDQGAFYSALDADSEGEEGLFYLWTKKEILDVLGPQGEEFCAFFQVTEEGNFEHGRNVLWRTTTEEDFALLSSNRSHAEMHKYVVECKRKLFEARKSRIRPHLDDKIITAWNALMAKGLIDAYRAFDQPEMLKMAYDNLSFIRSNLSHSDGTLFHSIKDDQVSVVGFLDDYAFTIEAYLAIYEATFHEEWLWEAKKLADHALVHFADPADPLFFYTHDKGEKLIARTKEIHDSVIPSSNSAFAMALLRLAALLSEDSYADRANQMLKAVAHMLKDEGRFMANWVQAWLMQEFPVVEIAFVGKQALKFKKEIDKIFFPNKVVCGTVTESKLPLLEHRQSEGDQTQIFVCQNKMCRLPVDQVNLALRQLRLLKEEMMQQANWQRSNSANV